MTDVPPVCAPWKQRRARCVVWGERCHRVTVEAHPPLDTHYPWNWRTRDGYHRPGRSLRDRFRARHLVKSRRPQGDAARHISDTAPTDDFTLQRSPPLGRFAERTFDFLRALAHGHPRLMSPLTAAGRATRDDAWPGHLQVA